MWNSAVLTITGTPLLITGTGGQPVKAKRLIVTPLPAASAGVVYVISVPDLSIASVARTNNNTVAALGPATATAPATPFRLDNIQSGNPPIEVSGYQIDGGHNGDTVLVSWELP